MRIGVDLGGTKIEVIALSEAGEELFRKRTPTPKDDYAQLVTSIRDLVLLAEETLGETASVGVGVPGSISKQTRAIKKANLLTLIGKPLEADLSKALSRPIRCSNDGSCLAVSEAVDGAGAGKDFVLSLILGTGFGSGIAVNKQTHDGNNLVAGEIGHVELPWMTEEERSLSLDCYCGFVGCNELWVSGTGFSKDFERHTGQKKTGEEILHLVNQGDAPAIDNLKRYENRLARVIASLVNIMDPSIVVLAGGMSNVDQLYQDVPNMLSNYVFGGECDTQVVKAKHGDSSGVRGAAWLWPQA